MPPFRREYGRAAQRAQDAYFFLIRRDGTAAATSYASFSRHYRELRAQSMSYHTAFIGLADNGYAASGHRIMP